MAGLLKEIWTGELLKKFRHEMSFLSRIPSADRYVNNDAINFADIGADPQVLINNITYPIPSAQRTDTPISISLDKYDTENTTIKDDELYALPYNKESSALDQHRETLEEKTEEKSLHALCPAEDTSDTPVVLTTGASNGETQARQRMEIKNIITMQRNFDLLKIPKVGRELVLNPYHVEDLLLTSQAFREQWFRIKSGEVLDMFGFMVTKTSYFPVFSNSSGLKKAFDAAPNAADDLAVSCAFYNRRAVKAKGSINLYHQKAENHPETRESKIGFRLYHICIPKKELGFGAIISDVT